MCKSRRIDKMRTPTEPQLKAEALGGLKSRAIPRPALSDADRFRDNLAPVNPGPCDSGVRVRFHPGRFYSAHERGVIAGREDTGEQHWVPERFDCLYFGSFWED